MNKRLLLPLLLLSSPLPAADLLSLDGEYRVDLWHNLDGGLQQGGTWLDDLGLNLSLDGEALGWSGFSAYLSGLSNNSNTFSDRYVGDLQGVSNIDTGAAIRLYEAWLQQGWGSGSVRAGLYDLNSEFDTIDGGALFLNSSFGIGPDFAQSGANGPSIFPVTGLALRLEQSLSETLLVRTAVLEGTPGDPAHPANTTIRLEGGEGWLGVAELEGRPGHWRWVVGGWRYSASTERIDGQGSGHNAGGYATLEYGLDAAVSDAGSRLFVRVGVADEQLNAIGQYLGAGVNHSLQLGQWPTSTLGLAIAHARLGDDYRTSGNYDDAETTLELTWQQPVNEWLSLQPDLQYIIDPGAEPALANSWVIGLRLAITPF